MQKYSDLLHYICDNEKLEIHENQQCTSFIPFAKQDE